MNLSLLYTWWKKKIRDHKWVLKNIAKKKKKNQDIVNAMDLVKVSKQWLQVMRDDKWKSLLTIVGGSCKRRYTLWNPQFAKIKEELEKCVHRSGQGLNQETNLKRPSDTRWESYYETILNLILMFPVVVDVLEIIEENGISDHKVEAQFIMRSILSFEFVFTLHLIKNILGITNELSIALEKKKKSRYSKCYGSC